MSNSLSWYRDFFEDEVINLGVVIVEGSCSIGTVMEQDFVDDFVTFFWKYL